MGCIPPIVAEAVISHRIATNVGLFTHMKAELATQVLHHAPVARDWESRGDTLQGNTSAGQGHLPGLALLPVKSACLDWWSGNYFGSCLQPIKGGW